MIQVRQAHPADADSIGAVHVASWREAYAGIIPADVLAGLSAEERALMWRRILRDPAASGAAAVLVAEDDGRIVGFGACGGQRDAALAQIGFSGEISAVYVLRSHQRRGGGRALMTALARTLAASGCPAASLWVLRENAPARTFYENLGGTRIGERIDRQRDTDFIELAYGWRDLAAAFAAPGRG